MSDSSGDFALGKYRLFTPPLGRGGYGTVYRAQDTVLNVPRAVKVLHPELAVNAEFIERFRREAQTAARLEHPHIVPVYDLGEQGGRFFLAMKYMPGGSLKDRLVQEGALPFDQALEIARQAAAALDALHRQKLVHRDLKPANLLFDEDGALRLSDLGFARALSEASVSQQSSGGIIGTPHYLAPEAWDGKLSPAVDQYALACIFCEMLTGQALFSGETPSEVMKRHIIDGPRFPEVWPPDAPPGLEAVLRRALAQQPEARFATAGEFVGALAGLAEAAAFTRRQAETAEKARAVEGRRLRLASNVQAVERAIEAKDWSLAERQIAPLESGDAEAQEAAAALRRELTAAQQQQAARIAGLKEKAASAMELYGWELAGRHLSALNEEGTGGQSAAVDLQARISAGRQQQARRIAEEEQKAEQAARNGDWGAVEAAVRVLNGLGKEGAFAAEPLRNQLAQARRPQELAGEQAERGRKEAEPSPPAPPPAGEGRLYFPGSAPVSGDPGEGRQPSSPRPASVSGGMGKAAEGRASVSPRPSGEGAGVRVRYRVLAVFGVLLVVALLSWGIWNASRAERVQEAAGTAAASTRMAEASVQAALATTAAVPTQAPQPTRTATLLPTETPATAVPPGMVRIPAGSFLMGSDTGGDEQPVHEVSLDAFYMDVYEVTIGRYTECVAVGACSASYCSSEANHPVVCVDWNQAQAYCAWIGGRLPTEAEWEFAARGGLEGKQYPWGDAFDGSLANFCDTNCEYSHADKSVNDGYAETAPVGSYMSNGYGLYDMAGNVWEWVSDWYGSGYYGVSPVSNPTGPETGEYRVLRGGSWLFNAYYLRVAYRFYNDPSLRNDHIGFRCAFSP